MVVKGTYYHEGKIELYPDIGYSFCNCRSVFYTNSENVWEPFSYEPVDGFITAPDIFFVEWGNNPNTFIYWNPRRYQTLWSMEAQIDHLKSQGYEIESAKREFTVGSKTPQHYHIKVRK